MATDTLSDLLRAVRLRGALFFDVEGRPPWVAEAPPSSALLPAIMPEAEHLIEFHGVVRGACFAGLTGGAPVRLEAGDVVLFPHGDAHVLSSTAGARSSAPNAQLPGPAERRPFALSVGADGVARPRAGSVAAEHAHVVCGFLGLDAHPFNPLLASLPRVLTLRGAASAPSWAAALLRSVAAESERQGPGGQAVLERMSEMLFVEVLRRYVDTLPDDQTGWLAGMRDPNVGRALALLHAAPAEPWTLERLCTALVLGRSALHERFAHLVGLPPMQYLTHWRMQLAARRLRDTSDKVVRVALDVGYESEAAFARAFKRVVGTSPGAWRRAQPAAGHPQDPAGRS